MCPCTYGGNTELVIDHDRSQLFVYDKDDGTEIGEVAYARGLVEHPEYFNRQDIAAVVHACRDTGVLMSPSDTSNSDSDHQADNEDSSCHGFSASEPSPPDFANIEDDPQYAAILYTIQQRNRSSTTYDMLDRTERQPLLGAQDTGTDEDQAPQQPIQQGVPPDAPNTPPQGFATPSNSPLHFEMRSGRIKQGAPKKRGGGCRGRR